MCERGCCLQLVPTQASRKAAAYHTAKASLRPQDAAIRTHNAGGPVAGVVPAQHGRDSRAGAGLGSEDEDGGGGGGGGRGGSVELADDNEFNGNVEEDDERSG